MYLSYSFVFTHHFHICFSTEIAFIFLRRAVVQMHLLCKVFFLNSLKQCWSKEIQCKPHVYFIFQSILAMPWDLQDLSFLTKKWTLRPWQWMDKVWTTGLPGISSRVYLKYSSTHIFFVMLHIVLFNWVKQPLYWNRNAEKEDCSEVVLLSVSTHI